MSHEKEIVVNPRSASIVLPSPAIDIAIRVATMSDLAFIDQLQKQHTKQLGFFPAQMEGYLKNEWVLVAEENGKPVGYVASRDRYLKRDELGVIYQLCVAQTLQRKLIGAALVKAVFERSAYGCRLYCCWCAQDLDANFFWQSLGFVPVAFRAGSSGKKRVHIFWQKRIVENDEETKWWYPCQTNQGAIREDRLVFPIPPGTHWKEVQAVNLPGMERKQLESGETKRRKAKATPINVTVRTPLRGGLTFANAPSNHLAKEQAPKREKREKQKVDPKLVTAARELRDRYLEHVNSDCAALPNAQGKYEVAKQIGVDAPTLRLPDAAPREAA